MNDNLHMWVAVHIVSAYGHLLTAEHYRETSDVRWPDRLKAAAEQAGYAMALVPAHVPEWYPEIGRYYELRDRIVELVQARHWHQHRSSCSGGPT